MADYTDNFNRADNTDLGAPWVESESDPYSIRVRENQVRFLGDGRNGLAYWDDAFTNAQYSQLIFKAAETGSFFAGVAVRVSGTYANATMYAAGYLAGVGLELRKWVGQTIASLGTLLGSYSVTFSVNDTLRIEAEGTTIRVKRNGVTVIEVTDSDVATGKAGLVSTYPVAYTDWDDWAGGDLEAPPPPPSGGFHHQVMQV